MIKLTKSSFYNEKDVKEKLVDFIMNEEILSMNKYCRQFEEDFANKQGRKHAVYVANGSVANLLLVQSLLNMAVFKKGDKIGFSALTWPTNVMPLIQLGLEPVAIDCSLDTLNISPEKLHDKISSLKGLFITNVLGFSDNLTEIRTLCQENDIVLIEDNCESLGSMTSGELLGNFGLASTFSFFVGHHMSTIEGGMVCTDDDELRDYLIMGRAHGWDRNLNLEKQQELRANANINEFYAKYSFYDLASNFRPTEIGGFIGVTQVPFWDEIVSKRAANYKRFAEVINNNDDFYSYTLDHMDIISNFAMPVVCKTAELAEVYRKKFIHADAEIRPVIAGNIARQPFYSKYVKSVTPCPNSDLVHENGFYFGNNPEMTEEEVDKLCKLLEK
jgi:CDP-6-deoxy-D-xylo-4-hexulose-3-dehydrase